MIKSPSGPLAILKFLVASAAIGLGIYACWDALRDFQLVTYTPCSEEEVLQRKKENRGIKITHLDTRTLELTPEAKEKLRGRNESRSQGDPLEEA